MAFNKKFFTTGGIVASSGACLTETTDIFGDSSGKALYSLDYDSSDTSNTFNGEPTNVDFGVGGYINTGARFNGSSSIITATQPSGINGPCSYSIWLKTTSSSYQSIITVGSVTGSHTAGVNLFVNSGKLSCQTGNGSDTENTTLNSTSNIDTGNWVHCVVTVAGSTQGSAIKIYVNKTNETSGGTANNTAIVTATGEKLCLGGRILSGSQSTFLNGSLDQARIFTKELNQQEINTLFDEQACVHTATTTDVDFPVTNFAYYKLDNSAEDSKGTNDGTETSSVQYRFGRYGQAAEFNGADGCEIITTINNGVLPVTSTFSVSAWFRYDSVGATTSPLGMTNTDNFYGWAFFASNLGEFSIAWNGAAPGFTTGSTHTIQVGIWFNAVFTYDGSGTSKMYINGILKGTRTSTTITAPAASLRMGDGDVWGTHNGAIDQVRIFTEELSDENVLKLAEEKPETDTSNFKAVLYKGTGANQYISNVGIDLETSGGLAWIKNRDQADNHTLVDSVRGISTSGTKYIASNETDAEDTSTNMPVSLEKNGFFVQGVAGITNTSGEDYVSWVWKGGGTPVTIGVNSITGSTPSIASSVSANTAAGFSIVKYTGSGSSGMTVGHGLNTAELVILKNLDATEEWQVFGTTLFDRMILNDTDADKGNLGITVTSTTFQTTQSSSFVGNAAWNGSGADYIAYCFHSVAGYSSIGSYSGVSTGTRTHNTGFKPSFVMIKGTNFSDSWYVYDNKRREDNSRALFWDLSQTEYTLDNSALYVTFVNTGFKTSGALSGIDGSGRSFIYMAFK